MSEPTETADETVAATRVRLTYDPEAFPADVRDWVHEGVTDGTFLASFRRRHDTVAQGQTFDEFVSCGCGAPRDVRFRVAAVEGGHRLDAGTAVTVERA